MHASRLVLLLCAALALSSCSKQQSADERAAGSVPPVAALTPQAQQQAAAQKPAQPAALTRPNEDGSQPVDDATGDSGARNAILAAVASTVAAAAPAAAAANLTAPTLWQEGVNYTRLVPSQPTAVPAGQVEVLEFFWYACPHCYAIDPLVESWKKTKPAYISFSRVHVTWSEGHRSLARLYYPGGRACRQCP